MADHVCKVCQGRIEYLNPTGDGLAGWWAHENHPADGHDAALKLGPLRVNGVPIPKEITNGSSADFARFCGETDPDVLAFLDAEQ